MLVKRVLTFEEQRNRRSAVISELKLKGRKRKESWIKWKLFMKDSSSPYHHLWGPTHGASYPWMQRPAWGCHQEQRSGLALHQYGPSDSATVFLQQVIKSYSKKNRLQWSATNSLSSLTHVQPNSHRVYMDTNIPILIRWRQHSEWDSAM